MTDATNTDAEPPFPVLTEGDDPEMEESGFYVQNWSNAEDDWEVCFHFHGETYFDTAAETQLAAQEYLDAVSEDSVREERRANAEYLRQLAREYERSGGEWGGYATALKNAALVVGRGDAGKETEASCG